MTSVLKPLTTTELLDKIFSLDRARFFLFAGIMALPHTEVDSGINTVGTETPAAAATAASAN